MITINSLIKVALLTVFLTGCGCEKLKLNEDEKEWISHFKNGQKQYYSNAKGQIDTLTVISSGNLFSPCNRVELSDYQYESHMTRFKFKSKNTYNGDESFIVISTEEWKQRIPNIYIGNLGPHRNDLENKLPTQIDTTVGNKKLNSVYCYVNGINAEQYGEIAYFSSFFWNKKLGLIAYTTNEDDFFILVKN